MHIDASSNEWTAIEEYEQAFNVRQLTGDVFPSATYGMNAPTLEGALENTPGTLTTEGKKIFPYLNGTVSTDTGTFGYEATPLTTQATGASFSTLVSESKSGAALVGIYTHANGIQEMLETFDQNQAQLQTELLRHGAINWVTRGVYFGEQRNYVEMDIDDTFTPDDSWNTATHEINYDEADALRMQPTDVDYAAKWSEEHHFRMDQLFNGGGSVAAAIQEASSADPLLAEFQKTNPATGKPYTDTFGWLSHTYDTPYLDVGCATQNYIEAELEENTNWAAAAPGATPGTGGLGLLKTTEVATALGAENPDVFVPGNHSGFADLVPGNPATVDEPQLDSAVASEEEGSGKLAAGTYEYAITDQFVSTGGESAADVTAPIEVKAGETVVLELESICHAADYRIYRAVAKSGKWSLIGTISTPFSATLPDNSVGEAASTSEVTGGGESQQTFTDSGTAGTAEPAGWTPPITENAVEGPWEQNPYFIPALKAVGITDVGADGSKAYPKPAETQFGIGTTYKGEEYAPDETFVDGTSQVVPRHPINIYYNASTEAQEVDEWNTLFGPDCVPSSTTTCQKAGETATFAEIVKSVVSGMFQNMMNNDPRPSYVHQTNIIGQPPAGEPTNSTPLPTTPEATGDGLLYSVLNPLLAEYNKYFASTAPYEQLTLGAIGNILAEQAAWKAAVAAGHISGYIEGSQVTLTNSGTTAINTPLTGITGIGTSYGGITAGWTSVPAGASTHTAPVAWPESPSPITEAPQGSWVGKYGSSGYALTGWDGTQDAINMPGVTETLVQGSRYLWAPNTTDVRALQSPDGSTRNAATDYDPNELKVQLGFTSAYTGNLHLYAVDWDNLGRRETITVNDGSGPRSVALSASFNKGAWISLPISVVAGGTVSINVVNNAAPATTNAVISGIFLGENAAPTVVTGQELSEGGWVGSFGSAGYDLAGWDGAVGDVSYMPNATVSLVQGSRWEWAANTTDVRALSEPGQLTRNAATYYDPNQIDVKLNFAAAYTGDIHLYAVDWDSTTRRESISVNGQTAVLSSSFNKGAWVSFPISVAAGGTVTITVDHMAGLNAVLSGIFLGDTGTPPAPTVTSAPQGAWTKTVGSAGYDLASWNNSSADVSDLPNASLSLVQGSRWQWAAGSTDPRALTDPGSGDEQHRDLLRPQRDPAEDDLPGGIQRQPASVCGRLGLTSRAAR